MKSLSRFTAVLVLPVVLIVGALVYARFLETPEVFSVVSSNEPILTNKAYDETPKKPLNQIDETPKKTLNQIEIPLNCSGHNLTGTCPTNNNQILTNNQDHSSTSTCPDYFRWIHEDLRPWAHTGVTKEAIEKAQKTANFKLVILKGKAYLETYEKAFQTRDTFTLWGILQLLRKYPGKLPDLELMFDCVDWPVVPSDEYSGPNGVDPPPLFRYCGNDATLDIVFPDWSFWGWPETNVKPWEILLGELNEGNKRIPWMKREPYAYWKGNPSVAETRQDLMKCNVSEKQEWNARLYDQVFIE